MKISAEEKQSQHLAGLIINKIKMYKIEER